MLSYLLVIVLSAILTLVVIRFIRPRIVVVLIVALLTATLFQLYVYFDLKYLDPFFLIAFALSSLLAGVASFLTLLIVNKRLLGKV